MPSWVFWQCFLWRRVVCQGWNQAFLNLVSFGDETIQVNCRDPVLKLWLFVTVDEQVEVYLGRVLGKPLTSNSEWNQSKVWVNGCCEQWKWPCRVGRHQHIKEIILNAHYICWRNVFKRKQMQQSLAQVVSSKEYFKVSILSICFTGGKKNNSGLL